MINGWSFLLPPACCCCVATQQRHSVFIPFSSLTFNARVPWQFSTHWLSFKAHLSLNCCNPLECLKSMPIYRAISSAFVSTTHIVQYCSFKQRKTKQLIFRIIMLGSMNTHVSKYHPLAKPAVQYNRDFLNTSTEWRVGFHMPRLFLSYFICVHSPHD